MDNKTALKCHAIVMADGRFDGARALDVTDYKDKEPQLFDCKEVTCYPKECTCIKCIS